MSTVESQANLVSDLRSGMRDRREHALQEVVAAYGGALFQLCLRVTCNQADAEDALQETWIDVDRGIAAFKAESKLSTWLFRIAIRHASRVRNQRRSRTTLEVDETYDAGAGVDPRRALEELEGARKLLDAIATLPLEQRVVLGLAAGEGLPHSEIAGILGIPEGTVGSRLHAARATLKQRLGIKD